MENIKQSEMSGIIEKIEKKEIERRFLVKPSKIPANYESFPNKRLNAKFYQDINGRKMRMRQEGDKYFVVNKGERTDGGMVRSIGPKGDIEISKEAYDILKDAAWGEELLKTRYYIPIGDDYVAEFDIYDDFKSAGFYTVEVEFSNLAACQQFTPPSWFGREVTNESGYSSRDLARKGLPSSFTRK